MKMANKVFFYGAIGMMGISSAQSQTPTADEMWQIIQEQQATIKALQQQVGETDQKVEAAGEMLDEVVDEEQGIAGAT